MNRDVVIESWLGSMSKFELIDQCFFWLDMALEHGRMYNTIKDENVKLRTFIRLKETCWKYVGWCDHCPYNGVDEDHYDCNCTVWEEIDSLAHELGIEVN